jgi:hypothetical protein
MFWIIFILVLLFAAWITYEIHRAPYMEDENDTLYDPTTTCWDDDKNHTEGDFN